MKELKKQKREKKEKYNRSIRKRDKKEIYKEGKKKRRCRSNTFAYAITYRTGNWFFSNGCTLFYDNAWQTYFFVSFISKHNRIAHVQNYATEALMLSVIFLNWFSGSL